MTLFEVGDRVIYQNNNGHGQNNQNGQVAVVVADSARPDGIPRPMIAVRWVDHTFRSRFGDEDYNLVYRVNLELVSAGASAVKEPDESVYNDLI